MSLFNSALNLFSKLFCRKEISVQPENNEIILSPFEQRIKKRNEFYTEFFTKEIAHAEPYKLIALNKSADQIFTIHCGVMAGFGKNKMGEVAPKIKDVLTGEIIDQVFFVTEFNEKVLLNIAKLSKGQLLTLLKMVSVNIDREMSEIKALQMPSISEEDITGLKENGFFDVEKTNDQISYVAKFWNSQCDFCYGENKIQIFNKNSSEREAFIDELISNNTLLMYISNENTVPSLSVVISTIKQGNNVMPVYYDLIKEEETFSFGMPHIYSETLKSCFEKLPKQMIHAILYGCEKENNPQDEMNKTVYENYEAFSKKIEKEKAKYNEIFGEQLN